MNFRKHGKPYICGVCKGEGHNARTCGKLPPAIASGSLSIRRARALFGVTGLIGGAR